MDKELRKPKLFLLAIVFVIGIAFAVFVLFYEHSKAGCIYMIQDAVPRLADMPKGVPFTASDVQYDCNWNVRGIIMLIGAGLIGLAISFQNLKKHKS